MRSVITAEERSRPVSRHPYDSGLAARLMRVSPTKLATLEATATTEFGNLLETFVVGELRKPVCWLDEPVTLGHWRTHDDAEVDLVVEFEDGRVLGFEVKANERVRGSGFNGLRALREDLGARFLAGSRLLHVRRSDARDADRLNLASGGLRGPDGFADPPDRL